MRVCAGGREGTVGPLQEKMREGGQSQEWQRADGVAGTFQEPEASAKWMR